MDCMTFRKYVGAFADSELEVQQNLEALEHLNMCPNCAKRVASITALRNALVRVYGDAQAPRRLRSRIAASMGADAVGGGSLSVGTNPRRSRWAQRAVLPLSAAALLAVTVFGWQYFSSVEPRRGTITLLPGRVVSDIRERHRMCSANLARVPHHDVTLPRDPAGIEEKLGAALCMTVLSPDYSLRGFDLIGADRCGIRGRTGAHVMYQRESTGVLLSVFSLQRLGALGLVAGGGVVDQDYYVATDTPVSVVVWHLGPQSFVLCGEFPKELLLDLASDVRTADVWEPGFLQSGNRVLASAGDNKYTRSGTAASNGLW